MKKKFLAILTSLTCMLTAITAIPSGAESVDTGVTIVSDNFVYRHQDSNGSRSFELESDLVSPTVMIVGILEYSEPGGVHMYEYVGSRINSGGLEQARIIVSQICFGDFGERELQVGDLLECGTDRIAVAEEIPPFFSTSWNYLGNGVDIFGEDFRDVIRWEMLLWDTDNQLGNIEQYNYKIVKFNELYNVDLIKGDVTIDDSVNILDCIKINKAMLAGAPLCDYARLAGDVNDNDTLDADDSLMILKETIGLTENFE